MFQKSSVIWILRRPVTLSLREGLNKEKYEESYPYQGEILYDFKHFFSYCPLTQLVPSLKPREECTTVPKEICNLKFTNPSVERKPLRTEWCLEEDDEANSIQVSMIQLLMTKPKTNIYISSLSDEQRAATVPQQMILNLKTRTSALSQTLQFCQITSLELEMNWEGYNFSSSFWFSLVESYDLMSCTRF